MKFNGFSILICNSALHLIRLQGSHSSWKIIGIEIYFKIMEKSLNFMKSSWNIQK